MDGRLSKNINSTSDYNPILDKNPKFSLDNWFFSVYKDQRGIVFRLTDYRQSIPVWSEFVVYTEEDKIEFFNPVGLWNIQHSLIHYLIEVVQHNAQFN